MRLAASLAIVAGAASACAHRQQIDIRPEFEEARTNCGLPRMLMQRASADPRIFQVRFPQRHDAAGTAERNGSWACLQHWAHERGFTLRLVGHDILTGE